MNDSSDPSDAETSDKRDDKDADFNVDDYRHDIDSDDAFNELLEGDINVSSSALRAC